MNINEILKMLDWNNDSNVQYEGRLQAERVNCLSIFMQPMDIQYNKNVWENCAIILSEKEDSLLKPYLLNLLDWLQDLNWPGSIIILERLQKYNDFQSLCSAIENRIVVANALGDDVWISNLVELLVREELGKNIKSDVYSIIKDCIAG